MPPGPKEKSCVRIYTDGGCEPNPGQGGWAAILLYGNHEKEIYGAEPNTTNNRMELRAAIEALKQLKRPCRVVLYTDSEYLKKGITEWLPRWRARGWRRADNSPVLNRDLWETLDALLKQHEIQWEWVRAHAGDTYNERCDELVRRAREEFQMQHHRET